jgi:hypothetical protein
LAWFSLSLVMVWMAMAGVALLTVVVLCDAFCL